MSDTTRINPHIAAVLSAAQFMPSNRAVRARNEFWKQPGVVLTVDADAETASALAPSKWIADLLKREWKTPGFSEWFTNVQWEQEEASRLITLSLQRLGEILEDEEDSSAVISAAKEVREVYKQLHAKQADKYADEDINTMSKHELEEYIRRNSNIINNIQKKS